jgi:hypothetical protein
MKKAQPDEQNLRILRFARKFLLLPFTLAAAIYALVCKWRQCGMTAKAQKEEDKQRQSRARRELRGLPPDHVQHPHAAREESTAS